MNLPQLPGSSPQISQTHKFKLSDKIALFHNTILLLHYPIAAVYGLCAL